uniref:Sidoreflexin n=1 Tax=Acrobeloides nanus TaxID=290746 RepID=A0A914CAF1_9BILA
MTQETIFGFPKYPKFELDQPRFPQETFLGRYLHYLDIIDPSTLFTSNKRVEESVQLLESYKIGKAHTTDEDLWKAQKIKQAIFHPDTGEKILPPFRMSGYVPFGWITVTGMLLPNPSWPTLLFWQWMNQSHNACVNYANRNATKPQPFSIYAKAYTAAVSAAMGISATTSLASTLNVLCMRGPELKTGIDVFDESGKCIGASKVAAKQAVLETALTRAFLPIPILLAPPIIMPFLERLKFVQKSAGRHLVVNAVVCTICFGLSLPVALALFPQQSAIETSSLEDHIRQNTRENRLYFNRGL